MGSNSTLRVYQNAIADTVARAYINELKKHKIRFDFPSHTDLQIETSVNLDTGVYIITLCGLMGDRLDNPTVGIQIPIDLLRTLRRGGAQYLKAITHFPPPDKLEGLVFDRLMQLKMDDILGQL